MEKPDQKTEKYDSLSHNHVATLIVLHNWKLGRFVPNFIDENITQEMFPFLMEEDLKILIPEMRERALFRKRVQEMAKIRTPSTAAVANESSSVPSDGTVLAEAVSEARAAVKLAVRAIELSPNKSVSAFYYPYKYQ